MPLRTRRRWFLLLPTLSVAAAVVLLHRQRTPQASARAREMPSPSATWPWPGVVQDQPHRGVTHWFARTEDGTELDLLRFDFQANPALRLELYDQDEDDAAPFDNAAQFWKRGVGGAVSDLDQKGRGPVIAAWNGLFFAAERGWGPEGVGRHVAPVVLNGRVRYNVGNHRWTFGVRQSEKGPEFKAVHLPDRETLGREFSYGAAGAQCLVREGQPLHLEPFPGERDEIKRGPVPSTPEEAGHIPVVDHVKTSRTSMGWSQDSSQLLLLVVTELDHEAAGNVALRRGEPQVGGWSVADLQRFWLAYGVWGAVNIDGGAVTQLAYRMPGGEYTVLPPRWAGSNARFTVPSNLNGAPAGGTLMYFYVREGGSRRR